MLKITILELILIGVPETILLLLSIYIFTSTKFDFKKISLSCVLFTISIFLIRMLPIQFGVHALLNLLVIILLCVNINKINTIKAIFACLISFIIAFICDEASFVLMVKLSINNINNVAQSPILKILYSIPLLLLYSIIILISNKIINTKKSSTIKAQM